MHSTTHNEMDSNALNTTECKGFPSLHVFVGLDNLKEMQSPKSDINFTFSWLNYDALSAEVKANNVTNLQDSVIKQRSLFAPKFSINPSKMSTFQDSLDKYPRKRG